MIEDPRGGGHIQDFEGAAAAVESFSRERISNIFHIIIARTLQGDSKKSLRKVEADAYNVSTYDRILH